jgi:dynein light chain 4
MSAAKTDENSMDMESFQRAAKYTLVKFTDMHAEMKEEAMDICITAVEKYTSDIEKCTQVLSPLFSNAICSLVHKSRNLHVFQTIKDQMDKKFGAPWHVVVGRAFAYEITTEVRTMNYSLCRHGAFSNVRHAPGDMIFLEF